MTPTHIMLQQCDGFCHQFGQSCIPTRVTKRSVPVLLSRCGIQSGLCAKECASLEVEEHAECACACQLTARDCPAGQAFRPELCACQCRDLPAKQACLDAGRSWHEATCSCTCQHNEEDEECPDGYIFDRQQTCSCQPHIVTSNEISESGHESVPHGSAGPFPSPEVIIIALLLAIILVLLSLVFSLVVRIQKMTRRMKLSRRQNNNNNSSRMEAEVIEEEEDEADREAGEEAEQLMIYTEVSCSTPSSGFYSEMGQTGSERSCADQQQLALLHQQQHQQQHQLYQQQQQQQQQHRLHQLYQPLCRPQVDFDALYQSAEAVRLNKKLFAGQHLAAQIAAAGSPTATPSPLAAGMGSNLDSSSDMDHMAYERTMPASFPIDEAVRKLQMTGNRLIP